MTIRWIRIGHLEKDEDWLGNNAAFTCPQHGCGKVYIVSALIHKNGRECPACGRSKTFVSGGRSRNGEARINGSQIRTLPAIAPAFVRTCRLPRWSICRSPRRRRAQGRWW